MDIGFAANYTILHFIDTTPADDEPTWAYLAAGIQTIEPDDEDETDETGYYDCEGVIPEDVVGSKMAYSVSGHRKYGDPAQDYIASLRGETGQARVTTFRQIGPDGSMIEGPVTVKDIKDKGGDANEKGTFECGLSLRGRPTIVAPTATELPETVTADAVTVKVGESATIEPNVTPTTASPYCVYAVEDDEVAKVDGSGRVTGVAEGTTKITLKCGAKPSVATTIEVTVEPAGD